MATLILCGSCKCGDHDRCEKGYTQQGLLGGWVCSCMDPGCIDKRRAASAKEDDKPERGWEMGEGRWGTA